MRVIDCYCLAFVTVVLGSMLAHSFERKRVVEINLLMDRDPPDPAAVKPATAVKP